MPDMFACPQTLTVFVRRWLIPFGVPIIGSEPNAVTIHHLERPVRCVRIIGCDRARILRPITHQLPGWRFDAKMKSRAVSIRSACAPSGVPQTTT